MILKRQKISEIEHKGLKISQSKNSYWPLEITYTPNTGHGSDMFISFNTIFHREEVEKLRDALNEILEYNYKEPNDHK